MDIECWLPDVVSTTMRVAIIGSGPSGFFVAGEVLKRFPECEVHMFEKRVAPYGLVRYGVAPDHQLTRRTIKIFNQTADQSRFHYWGNVEAGRDVSFDDLHAAFHAVVICTGAEQPNRPGIPGARLRGAVDALDFARWTNGERDAFSPELLHGVETAVIIGNGNVALDAARMLARPSVDWVPTDMAVHAMEALIHHRIKHIVIVGRRGPEHISFTEAEWLEVVSLPGWGVQADGDVSFGALPDKPSSVRTLEFKFSLVPVGLLGDDHVSGVQFTHAASGESVVIPSQLVIFATGHRGIKIDGLPFDDERGIIPNDKGRVVGIPDFYVCGWIKHGATGLIGHNRKDAMETVARMLEDLGSWSTRRVTEYPVNKSGRRVVTWNDWKRLDAMEIQRGSAVGRPRINFMMDEALQILQ